MTGKPKKSADQLCVNGSMGVNLYASNTSKIVIVLAKSFLKFAAFIFHRRAWAKKYGLSAFQAVRVLLTFVAFPNPWIYKELYASFTVEGVMNYI